MASIHSTPWAPSGAERAHRRIAEACRLGARPWERPGNKNPRKWPFGRFRGAEDKVITPVEGSIGKPTSQNVPPPGGGHLGHERNERRNSPSKPGDFDRSWGSPKTRKTRRAMGSRASASKFPSSMSRARSPSPAPGHSRAAAFRQRGAASGTPPSSHRRLGALEAFLPADSRAVPSGAAAVLAHGCNAAPRGSAARFRGWPHR